MFCPTIVWQKKCELALSPVLGFQGSSASIPSDTARMWTAKWWKSSDSGASKSKKPQKVPGKQTTLKPWWLYPDARNTYGSGYFRPFLVNLWERHLAKLRIKWYHPCVLDAFQCARSCKDRPANRLDAIAALRTISSPAPGDKLYPGLDDTTLLDRDLCRVRTCTSNNKNISKANVAVSRQFSNQWIIRIQHDSTHSN